VAERLPRIWQVVPAVATFVALFVLPIGFFLVVSFWRLRSYRLVPDHTLDNYAQVVEQYLWPTVFTLLISLTIATLTTVLGLMIAYFARFRAGRMEQAMLFLVLATLFGGYLVKIYAWKTILGAQGILNQALQFVALTDAPVTWLLYSPVAVIITLVHFLLPFAVLPIYASLCGITGTLLEAARDLGASGPRAFRDIIVPLAQTGIFGAFCLCFLITAGDYVTPRLVGGPDTFMVGNFIESQFINRLNAPIGSALSFSMMAVCGLTLVIVRLAMIAILKPR
jgi:spermidine/putrescine transport system permease protein